MPGLIPLPYHSAVLTNNNEDTNSGQLAPQPPFEGTDKDYDTMAVDCSPESRTKDFVFPCQPDTVRAPA